MFYARHDRRKWDRLNFVTAYSSSVRVFFSTSTATNVLWSSLVSTRAAPSLELAPLNPIVVYLKWQEVFSVQQKHFVIIFDSSCRTHRVLHNISQFLALWDFSSGLEKNAIINYGLECRWDGTTFSVQNGQNWNCRKALQLNIRNCISTFRFNFDSSELKAHRTSFTAWPWRSTVGHCRYRGYCKTPLSRIRCLLGSFPDQLRTYTQKWTRQTKNFDECQ